MTKKYFIVGSPMEQYYPWLMESVRNSENFFFDSVEEAKQAIADYNWQNSKPDDYWIGEKIEYDVDEINAMRKPFEEWRNQ